MTDTIASRTPDGRFHNPWPESEPHGFGDVFKWMMQRRGQQRAADPPRNSFPVVAPRISYPRAKPDEFTATWIGHATVLLQVGGLNVITDPMFSQRASPVQFAGPRRIMDPALAIDKLPPIDIVLLSHNHYDHLDKASVKHIVRSHPNARWVGPLGLGAYVKPWGVRDIIELDWWQSGMVGDVKVTATPARHFTARGFGDRNKSLWCGFAFEVAGKRIWFAGDTAYHPAFGEIGARWGPFDFVMIPIGAYDPRWFMSRVHVDAEEAVQIYQDVIASHPAAPHPLMLSIHWGTFRLTDEPMDEPPHRVAARWRAVGLNAKNLWTADFGETRDLP